MQQKGFTLIELMVVVAIIGIVSVLVLANYRQDSARQSLVQAEQKLISDLRRAQNMAMSGTDINNQYYGVGIYIDIGAEGDNGKYIIYGEKQQDNRTYNSGSDTIIETINLPPKIIIQSVSSGNNKLGVFYEPPDPRIYLDVLPVSGQATINLQAQNSGLPVKTITVNDSGLVQGN